MRALAALVAVLVVGILTGCGNGDRAAGTLAATADIAIESFGTGGATIEGQAISVDGHVTPVRYRWYESDIRQAKLTTTWSDAGRAIDRFAFQLGRGDVYARR